jgi:hypothetical protein
MGKRTLFCCLLMLWMSLLSGCGERATSQTPEDVHAAWVQALQQGDRSAALALVAEQPSQAAFVDERLRAIRDKITAASSPTGPLQSVEVRSLDDDGQQKTGVSIWRFQRRTDCYRTILTATPAGWKVVGWGTLLRCPDR